jgi:hypothetical protein
MEKGAHLSLVHELNDGTFGAGCEHRSTISTQPAESRELRMLLLDTADVLGVSPGAMGNGVVDSLGEPLPASRQH